MIKIAVRMPAAVGDAGEFVADVRALEAAGADAIWVRPAGDEHWALLGAIAAVTQRVRIGLSEVGESNPGIGALQKVSGGRIVLSLPPGETWSEIPMPPDRESWSAALRRHTEAGSTGVVVPWDERLIDLLRNPGEEDRSDLLMSTG